MKSIKNKPFRFIITIVSLILVVVLSRSIYSLWRRGDVTRDRKEALRKVEGENKRLKEQLQDVQSPEFIEKQAREKLGLVKEGEAIVLLPKSQISNPNDQKDQKNEENLPNWKKWWKLFF